MIRILFILSVLVLVWYIVYPTYKDGSVYYGAGDARKDGRKSFSLSVTWKTIINKFKKK